MILKNVKRVAKEFETKVESEVVKLTGVSPEVKSKLTQLVRRRNDYGVMFLHALVLTYSKAAWSKKLLRRWKDTI